jgi:Citrate synthase, C-terminal domain
MMMFSVPTEPYEINPIKVRALELFLILHMDHEQNASTSTVRNAGLTSTREAYPKLRLSDGCSSKWVQCLWPCTVVIGLPLSLQAPARRIRMHALLPALLPFGALRTGEPDHIEFTASDIRAAGHFNMIAP